MVGPIVHARREAYVPGPLKRFFRFFYAREQTPDTRAWHPWIVLFPVRTIDGKIAIGRVYRRIKADDRPMGGATAPDGLNCALAG